MGALTDPVHLAIKSGIAASAAMVATQVLHVPDALSAGFVAVLCVSPTAYAGLRRGAEQLAGSLLGGALTWALMRLLPSPSLQPLVVLLAVFGSVRLCFALPLGDGYTVAGFSAMYVVAMPFASASFALGTRLLALALGIAAATATNLLVSRLFGPRILDRRMRLTRARVAAVLASLPDRDSPIPPPPAAPTSGPAVSPSPPQHAPLDDLFEPAFAVVAELHADLDSAAHEPRHGTTGRLAREHLAEAIGLRTLLHLAKTLVLLDCPTAALDPARAALQRGESLPAGAVDDARRSLRRFS
jgi:hypothetical protein